MIDKEFICIWNDSLEESKKEFSKEFIEITSKDDKEGVHTFFFSRFSLESYKLVTDVLYSIIYEKTVLFFWPSSNSLVIELDENLDVVAVVNVT